MQSTSFRCIKCEEYNDTYYPIKNDKTTSELGQKTRDEPPLSYISTNLHFYIGFRKCKKCQTYQIVIFTGWWTNKYVSVCYPERISDNQGTISIDVAKWILQQCKQKNIKIPKQLRQFI